MKAESDQRRRLIAAEVVRSQVRATVYDAGRCYPTERDRRTACLHALVDDAAARSDRMLVLEQDDTLISWDNQQLVEATRRARCGPDFRYEHRRAKAEMLLALPDVIAWCCAKGGDWRRRIEPVIDRVIQV